MTKFTYEQNLAAIKLYLKGQSPGEIIKNLILESMLNFFLVKQYKRHGPNILNPKKFMKNIVVKFKLNVLNWKKQYHETYEATALKFVILNPGTVYQWQKTKDKGDFIASNKNPHWLRRKRM